MKKSGGKLRIDDLTPADFAAAREIIHAVVASQTVPVHMPLGILALSQILKGHWGGAIDLCAGLNVGLNAGLDDGLNDGLYAGLNDGLYAGLDDGLNDGLYAGLNDGLYAGFNDGLYAGLDDGLYAGLNDGLDYGLYAGLDYGLNAGLDAGLDDGLNDGLYAGLDARLRDGVREGIYSGISWLNAGLAEALKGTKLCYCGIWWSWYLAGYLIAEAWGCKLDAQKLLLLRAFCLLCPIIGERDGKPVILPKPQKIRWRVAGKTAAPFEFPIYELHGNGEPSVEYWGLFNLYHWHNTKIPGRMGTVNCERWEPKWLLDEKNAEVRRILIKEIGYERAIATLGAEVRGVWREYTLLSMTVPDMPVRYQLLRMVCPSTGEIHFLRVPPDVATAEQAITWCNHGLHPNNFEIQA